MRFLEAAASAALIIGISTLSCPPAAAVENSCEVAIRAAETITGLPPGLLLAVGQVEARHNNRVWPWSLNIGGRPVRHSSYVDAVDHLTRLLANGPANVDVGCLQLNMYWVGRGLRVEEVLDPQTNAIVAARHIVRLRDTFGSWTKAVGHYHTYRPGRQKNYVCAVAREYAKVLRRDIPRQCDR